MRFLLKVSIPVEAGNKAAREDRLGETIAAILGEQKPEAVDASQIPAVAEPWFLAFNASIELHPVMIPDDLKKATPHIQQAVKKYGK
jgi:hypothetical protein